MTDALRRLAPAKVNLFLRVGPVEPDGYHPVSSLAVFADVGDEVCVRPADRLSLIVTGPFASALDAPSDDNLVIRGLRALGVAAGIGEPPLAVTLDKRLPVAAGLGGGSSDAGAALLLAREALKLDVADAELERIAAGLGADGPLCLWARPALATGRGEVLAPAPRLPQIHAVLVNPGAPSSTPAVYREYDADPTGPIAHEGMPDGFDTMEALCAWLGSRPNALEAPAIRLTPVIGDCLSRVAADPNILLARVSGSGATVFGLCRDAAAAQSAAARLRASNPGDWIVVCRLGDA